MIVWALFLQIKSIIVTVEATWNSHVGWSAFIAVRSIVASYRVACTFRAIIAKRTCFAVESFFSSCQIVVSSSRTRNWFSCCWRAEVTSRAWVVSVVRCCFIRTGVTLLARKALTGYKPGRFVIVSTLWARYSSVQS